MNRLTLLSAAGLLIALDTFAPHAPAADEFKPEDGYTLLFNGKDLTGWVVKGAKDDLAGKTEAANRRFEAKDGIIICHPHDADNKGGIKDLYTVQEFDKDFHLKLEFRAGEKADSGVYIRGPQLQIRDFIRRGEQKQLTKFKNDDWNELEITVKGTEATCLCNGESLGTLKVPAKGGIGLQAESGKFEYRRIRIKELK